MCARTSLFLSSATLNHLSPSYRLLPGCVQIHRLQAHEDWGKSSQGSISALWPRSDVHDRTLKNPNDCRYEEHEKGGRKTTASHQKEIWSISNVGLKQSLVLCSNISTSSHDCFKVGFLQAMHLAGPAYLSHLDILTFTLKQNWTKSYMSYS